MQTELNSNNNNICCWICLSHLSKKYIFLVEKQLILLIRIRAEMKQTKHGQKTLETITLLRGTTQLLSIRQCSHLPILQLYAIGLQRDTKKPTPRLMSACDVVYQKQIQNTSNLSSLPRQPKLDPATIEVWLVDSAK